MNGILLVAFGCALVDWFAVARANKTLEYIFKPAPMLVLIAATWLALPDTWNSWLAQFFLLGFIFCLAGDVFLMLPNPRYFVFGLAAFLGGHLCYIIGLNATLPPLQSTVLLIPIALILVWFLRNIVRALQTAGHHPLVVHVVIYGIAISLMLWSAWATLFRPEWDNAQRALVILGATLFFISDALLAWNRFVKTFAAAKLGVIITYHLGQIALAAVVIS